MTIQTITPLHLGKLISLILVWSFTNVLAAAEFSPGLSVGSKAPELKVLDQQGQARKLSELTGSKGLLVVFNRSAEWCPYCQSQLIKLERRRKSFAAMGINLVSVTRDKQAAIAKFAKARRINFPLLADNNMQLIKAFGVLNQEYPPEHSAYGVPHPGMFYVDKTGYVRAKYFSKGYVSGPDIEKIMNDIKTK